MSSYQKVAIAGATGNLGPSIVQELINAGYQVTVLTRATSGDAKDGNASKKEHHPGVSNVVYVDYTSHDSLTAALQGQDALVSNVSGPDVNKSLIDAALAAGVKRFFTADFGSDVWGNEKTAALPVFKNGKTIVKQYLVDKVASSGGALTWTAVVTGLFLDFALKMGLLLVRAPAEGGEGQVTRFWGDGTQVVSTTTLADVGRAVVGVLKHPEETANRAVYVQSAAVSEEELLAIREKLRAQRSEASGDKVDAKEKVEKVDLTKLEKDSYAKLESGEPLGKVIINFVIISLFGKDHLANWAEKSDNELLGLKGLSASELEDIVATSL